MQKPVPPSVRTGRAASGPSAEVRRAKALYLRAIRARIRDGSYLTGDRVRTAVARLLRAVEDDLPGTS